MCLTSNLGHLFLDLAQAEYVLGRENGSFVDKSVVYTSDVTWTEHEAHRTTMNAQLLQV